MQIESDVVGKLGSLDEWGDRKTIIPASVHGKWRTWRTQVQIVLLLIFMILPWTKINGMQTVWLDIPSRRFILFGRVFLSHEAPLIFFILGIAVLSLALTTALWGRVWCGWACPQTVFIDGLFRRIETWIEGDYIKRRKMRNTPPSFEKALRTSLKWVAFLLVSSIIAHSFIAYFAGAEPLLRMIRGAPQNNWGYFLSATFVTALVAFDFGWFREQFCIIMCPYGRLQSVLMDDQSVTVAYDQPRGEPRKGTQRDNPNRGDCVSCNRCVEVCPTGIDIRRGVQMECIACTACIDACNEIMARVKKPANLIQYQNAAGTKPNWLRPRTAANGVFLVIFVAGLVFNLASRREFYASVLRAKDMPYQVLPNGEVINHFKLHLHNQSQDKQTFEISIPEVWLARGVKITQAQPAHDLMQGQDKEVHVFVTFPKSILAATGEAEFEFVVRETKLALTENLKLRLAGPKTN
jgi:cytochrome c oxidase accessory protein FixG